MFNNVFKKIVSFLNNVEKYCSVGEVTDGNIMWRMRIACWITKATDTHSEYVICIVFFTATMVTRTRISRTL
jgi:hypothetical protein